MSDSSSSSSSSADKNRLDRIAARVLADDADSGEMPAEEARTRSVEAVVHAMRLRKRQRRLRVIATFSAAAIVGVAASIALVVVASRGGSKNDVATTNNTKTTNTLTIGSASFVTGSPTVMRQGKAAPLSEGAALEAGDRVVVQSGSRATMTFAFARSGTHLVLEDGADVAMTSGAPMLAFSLATGVLHGDVAKLEAGEGFVIRTPDAEVEVRDASHAFDVSRVAPIALACDGSATTTTTRVVVRDGVVVVRPLGANGAETIVRASEVWPRDCKTVHAPSSSSHEQPIAASSPAAPKQRASELAVENDLFESAIAKKRAGNALGAVTTLDELLARFPSSHLAQSARAERMKLLRGLDPDKARAAARDYLAKHPNGFAKHDADLILATE